MLDRKQFGAENETRQVRTGACVLCEALLPDAVDGNLSAAERAIFDRHVASCVECAREMEEAQRGAAWLSLLKDHAPEPPAALLQRILADTTGASAPVAAGASSAAGALIAAGTPEFGAERAPAPPRPDLSAQAPVWAVQPAANSGWWRSLRGRIADAVRIENAQAAFHPRLAMTAAMAFFSLALSLNMAGVRLHDLRAEDFTPSGVQRAVADASASAERSFQNLRVVYQMESRVDELRTGGAEPEGAGPEGRSDPGQPPAAPARRQDGTTYPVSPEHAAPAEPHGKTDPPPQGSSELRMPAGGPKKQDLTERI